MADSYIITIDGVDRTADVTNRSVSINDAADDLPSTMSLVLEDLHAIGVPEADQEIIVMVDGDKRFGGYILSVTPSLIGGDKYRYALDCIDYSRVLDRRLVVANYQDMTDRAIIIDIVQNYCQYDGITTENVTEGITIPSITFNYMSPSECFARIAKLAARTWYIDYDKDIHYFPLTTNAAPFDITETSSDFYELSISKNNQNIRNRVYVRGGTKLSDPTTLAFVADGEQTVFPLPDKPHDITMTVGGVSKTIGIKNVSDPADFDYLLNFQEKYVEVGSASVPTASTVVEFTYSYDIPILIALEDTDSINDIGPFEYAIFDSTISTTNAARDRAQAELTQYANTIIDGSFSTRIPGFRAGQFINVNHAYLDVNDDYLVTNVDAKSLGAGDFEYTITLASAKKLGIIRFLVGLLEQDKNLSKVTDDEVVDELFTPDGETVTVTDGSITETAVDITVTPALWDGNSDWDFFQWG